MARVINAIEVALEASLVPSDARWSSLIATQLGQSVNQQNVFSLIIRDQRTHGMSFVNPEIPGDLLLAICSARLSSCSRQDYLKIPIRQPNFVASSHVRVCAGEIAVEAAHLFISDDVCDDRA
jgi:hypothetical protein